MTRYHYKAKNQLGEAIEGTFENGSFTEAVRNIQQRGLELISLEEVKVQMKELQHFVFDALDGDGEKVRGTIQGENEGQVKEMLKEEFGYQVTDITLKTPENQKAKIFLERPESITAAAPHQKDEPLQEGIIFNSRPRAVREKRRNVPDSELENERHEIKSFLSIHREILSNVTKERLAHLDSMIDLIRESQNKQRWKNLKREIKKAIKIAEREVSAHQDQKWKEQEAKAPIKKVQSYADFDSDDKRREIPIMDQSISEDLSEEEVPAWKKSLYEEPVKQAVSQKNPQKSSSFISWLQVIDLPDENDEEQVLAKQQYESIWMEVQRFSGALMAFYIGCFFIGYYLKRNGIEDHFMIRIYDTTLFKQLVLGLFAFFGLASFRLSHLEARVKSDAIVLASMILLLGFIFL